MTDFTVTGQNRNAKKDFQSMRVKRKLSTVNFRLFDRAHTQAILRFNQIYQHKPGRVIG